jgi:hypothetical protein
MLALFAPGVRAQQLLRSDPPAIDFGRRAQNQLCTAQARLTNATSASLTILSVQGDCACLTADVAVRQLAPGESSALIVRMESGGSEGDFQHSLVVDTTAGPAVTIPVRMSVYQYADWALSPPRVILPPSRRGAEAVGELRLNYRGGDRPRIASVASDSPWIEITPAKTTGNTIVYAIRKRAGAPGGAVYGDIRIATANPVSPAIEVPVFAYVTSTTTVDPNPIIMPVVPAGATTTAEVRIKGWDGASPPRPEVSGGHARVTGGKGRDLIVEVSLSSPVAGSSTHTLSLYDGSQAVVAVPVVERTSP